MEGQKSGVLVAYFSRAGEQYGVGNIAKGNTQIAAEIIAKKLGADIFEIAPATDSYPKTYAELIEFAKRQKQKSERPPLKNSADIGAYKAVFLGYPNWWGDIPMPVYTFLESLDFSGKSIAAFCTHEGSGIGSTAKKISAAAKGAEMLAGFEIYGHTVQNAPSAAEREISNWLAKIGF